MIPLRDTIPSSTFPFINYAFILLNLLLFLYQVSLGYHLERFLYIWGVVPAKFFAPLTYGQIGLMERAAPLFTAMFLHGRWLHALQGRYLFDIGRAKNRSVPTRFIKAALAGH